MSTRTWAPPDQPEPSAILKSAEDDTRNGEYATALAKFLWFHYNAVRYKRTLYGFRLSFAQRSWRELSSLYPPALVALMETRDDAEQVYLASPANRNLFQDAAALNHTLAADSRTVELFERVTQTSFESAKAVYLSAERHLIRAGRYELCSPFLQPEKRLFGYSESYRLIKEREDAEPEVNIALLSCAKSYFVRSVATLIALLALNGRKDEAMDVIKRSLDIVDDNEVREAMEAALSGHFPER